MTASVPLGRFVWYELLTTDPAGAAAFYTSVLGWSTKESQTAAGLPPYTEWVDGDGPLGGLMELPAEAGAAGAPPHWLAYISTPDTDATLGRAWERGAKVLVEPMEIPDVGRIAVLTDPQGAAFAVYSPARAGEEPPPEPRFGRVSWHELATDDHRQAFAFYEHVFGWTRGNAFDMGPAGTYQLFGNGGPPVGGMFDRPPEIPVPNWLLYVRVADLEGVLGKVEAHGGRVLNGPEDVPGGDRVAQCLDPQGAAFALHVRAAR